jgi:hypothetical protein
MTDCATTGMRSDTPTNLALEATGLCEAIAAHVLTSARFQQGRLVALDCVVARLGMQCAYSGGTICTVHFPLEHKEES